MTVHRAVVHLPRQEERDYERSLRQIALRRRRVDQLQAELALLRGALDRFEALCRARVGDLLAELRRVGQAAADYERRVERLRLGASSPDPTDLIEEEPAPFARQPPPDPPIDEPVDEPAVPQPRPVGAVAAEAKRLYLDLAKRCHPDRARDDAERRRREALMLRVNEAFRQHDLAALRALRREAEGADPAFAERPVGERLAWSLAELARLDDLLVDLRAEIIFLRRGETHRLWRRHEAGEPVIDQLERDLDRRLAKEGRRLDALIATYRRLRDERRPTSASPSR